MSHRVSRKTFRHFEMRQRRDLARFKAEVLDAVARMTPPDAPAERLWVNGEWVSSDSLQKLGVPSRTFGNGEADT